MRAPKIVGIGGTADKLSSTEYALMVALSAAEAAGSETKLFGGQFMARLPHYSPKRAELTEDEQALVTAVREADGLIVASPGYHGNMSGLVKNALDLLEETARDPARVYLTDMPVGIIATAYGWQAAGSTIAGLRAVVHAFRAWPTPYAAGINSVVSPFDPATGTCAQEVMEQLATVGQQVHAGAARNLLAAQVS